MSLLWAASSELCLQPVQAAVASDQQPYPSSRPVYMLILGCGRGWVLASADEQAGAQQMPLAAVVSVQGVNSSVRASSHHGTYYR